MPDRPLPLEISIEARAATDRERLRAALDELAADDPSFEVHRDAVGHTILCGDNELHLDTKVDVIKRTYKIDANLGAPSVAYRETLGRAAEIDYTHKRQTDGSGQFARVRILFEPTERGSGYLFQSKVISGNVPKECVPGVENGLAEAKQNGLLAGFPVIDFRATLIDGAYHNVDSSVLAFEIAARSAFRELRDRAHPKLLEPIMKVEVVVARALADAIAGWFTGRGVEIGASADQGGAARFSARAPLARILGLWRFLVGSGVDPGDFQISFDGYAPVEVGGGGGPDLFPPAAALRA
jgi:elongation factor G